MSVSATQGGHNNVRAVRTVALWFALIVQHIGDDAVGFWGFKTHKNLGLQWLGPQRKFYWNNFNISHLYVTD